MYIIFKMTCLTLFIFFDFEKSFFAICAFMTFGARHFCMFAVEPVFGRPVMIEFDILPLKRFFVYMTIVAGLPQGFFMNVFVTGTTLFFQTEICDRS